MIRMLRTGLPKQKTLTAVMTMWPVRDRRMTQREVDRTAIESGHHFVLAVGIGQGEDESRRQRDLGKDERSQRKRHQDTMTKTLQRNHRGHLVSQNVPIH